MQLVDECGESEDDAEGSYRAGQSVDQNELEVFAEVLLLEVVTACEDHGGQQTIEKDLLVEVHLRDVVEVVQQTSEDEAYEDTNAGLVEEVDLGWVWGTCLCSKKLPMRE